MRTLIEDEDIKEVVDRHYKIDIIDCVLHKNGTHDVYKITGTDDEYYFKVYRHGFHIPKDIEAEIWLLNRLVELNAPVSVSLPKVTGAGYVEISAPEGMRYGVLYEKADGVVGDFGEGHLYQHGSSLASIHLAADSIQGNSERFHLDLNYLLVKPFNLARPFLDQQLEKQLSSIIQAVRNTVKSLEQTKPYYGLCHGDAGGFNCHITENKVVTHFDFDFCGYGWRSYDLAVFLWSRHMICKDPAIADQHFQWFLNGYQSKRLLSTKELICLPYFVVCRAIWMVALRWRPVDTQHQVEAVLEWQMPFINYWIADGRIQI